MKHSKQKGHAGTILLVIIMILCFAGAAAFGYLIFQEMQTRGEAHESSLDVQQLALHEVTSPAASSTPAPVLIAEPSAGTEAEPLPEPTGLPAGMENGNAVPMEPDNTAAPVTSMPEESTDAEIDIEIEDEEIDDDTELQSFMEAEQSGQLKEIPRPAFGQLQPAVGSEDGQGWPEQPQPVPETEEQSPDVESADDQPEPIRTAAPAQITPEPTAPRAETDSPAMTPGSRPGVTPEHQTALDIPQLTVGRSVESSVHYTVDFDVLAQVNPDIRGWLLQEGTEINYPVMQAQNNEYYLDHMFNRKQNKAGSIFMDCGNSFCFTDGVTYLYGHNRHDNSMFAIVPEYKSMDFWRAHPTMTLMTPYEDYLVEIFACVRRSVKDEQEWRTRGYTSRADFEEAVGDIIGESFIDTGIVPQWGDQLLALCTCTNEVRTERYILYARLRPLVYLSDDTTGLAKQELDAIRGTSREIEVPGRGKLMYYAQNDPVWARMIYASRKSDKRRTFGAGGCAPTSMAMVLANMVDPEYYWWLNYYSGLDTGLLFCTHSVNQYFCNHTHAQYRLQSAEEFRRYMPVAVASYATGNNLRGIRARGNSKGTSSVLFGQLAQDFGLQMTVGKDRDTLLENLRQGGLSVVNTGGSYTPYTGGGHYMVAVSADDEYIYIFDPYMKNSYRNTDKRHVIEMLEPGLIRVKIADWHNLALYTSYNFRRPKEWQ